MRSLHRLPFRGVKRAMTKAAVVVITLSGRGTWSRPPCGLLAAGNTAVPLRALIYLAARQEEDGSFPQNFWVDGEAFWKGMQLDEVAFPVLLAWRLHQLKLLGEFNPRVMVNRAVAFLLHSGPVTGEERWEEASGYSPSTLAVIIAAFICAASFARAEKDSDTAIFLESYADFLRAHLDEWTVTSEGSLVHGEPRYFVRLNPAKPGEAAEPGCAVNEAGGVQTDQPASGISRLLSGSRHRRCGISATGSLWHPFR